MLAANPTNLLSRCAHPMRTPRVRLYSSNSASGITKFKATCSQSARKSEYPLSTTITSNVPVYDAADAAFTSPSRITLLKHELHRLLHDGPGVYILKHMYSDPSLLTRVNTIFSTIIAREASTSKGDHFAASGSNSRIWNSFGKHCLADPASFVAYYANPWLHLASESWLGPAYRITAQTNIVRPGGAPQVPHRDYHLGFQTAEATAQFPRSTQVASQFLTLQGAVAHTDMPLESGPTRFLPYSQTYADGYLAYRDPTFQQFFAENWVSLPLEKGDGVFFNPAVFHAAGENRSKGVQRSANLLQVSSAFGRAMETVDTMALIEKTWEYLRAMFQEEGMSERVGCVLKTIGEGYPFPTNLDRRPPAPGGMAPEDEQSLLRRMLVADAGHDVTMSAISKLRQESEM